MASAVEHIAIPEQTIAYLPAHGSLRQTGEPFARLFAGLAEVGASPAGPPMARFELDISDPDDADFEVAVPIDLAPGDRLPDNAEHVRSATLPAHYALVMTHNGPYEEIGAGYTALTEELTTVGAAVAGPASEVYLVGSDSGVAPADFVTEVQVPIVES